MYYVIIGRLNGRNDYYNMSITLRKHGYDEVEYCSGDECSPPHLRFMYEEDAVAYCLTTGNTYSTKIPDHK